MRQINYVFIILGVLCLRCSASDAGVKARAASALMGQFESVFYSSSTVLSGADSHGQLSPTVASSLHYPFQYLDLALAGLRDNSYADLLLNSAGVLVGAKNFRPPQGAAGLGAVRSERCYVVILGDAGKFDLQQHFRTKPVAILASGPVWKWATHIDEFGPEHIGGMPAGKPKLSVLFATKVGRYYILVSNNFKELQDVANKLVSADNDLKEITKLYTWDTISRYEVWGYRRYRYSGVINKQAAGMEDVSPGTESIACVLDFKRRMLTVRLFLGSAAGKRTVDRMTSRKDLPPLTLSRKRLWETSILLSGDNKSIEEVTVVVGLFGFRSYS